MPNQRPSLSSLATLPTAGPSGTQLQSRHRMRVQLGVGQAYTYQGTIGGRYRDQIPFNLDHGAYPVDDLTVYPPHSSGELHPLLSGHSVSYVDDPLCYVHLKIAHQDTDDL